MSDDLDLNAIAHQLYPNALPDRVVSRTPPTEAEIRQAERLYPPRGVDPDLPQAGEGIYSASAALRQTTEANFVRLYDAGLVKSAQKEDAHREVTEMTRKLNLDWGFVRLIENAHTDALLADRLDEPGADAALAAQIRANDEGNLKRLRGKYGAEETDDLMDRVARFRQQDARLAARLDRRGIGSRPEILDATIDEMRRQAFR
jgi:hypothetical protein